MTGRLVSRNRLGAPFCINPMIPHTPDAFLRFQLSHSAFRDGTATAPIKTAMRTTHQNCHAYNRTSTLSIHQVERLHSDGDQKQHSLAPENCRYRCPRGNCTGRNSYRLTKLHSESLSKERTTMLLVLSREKLRLRLHFHVVTFY